MGDLIVPLALWNTGGTTLQSVTSILVSPDKRNLVTGTSSGRIYLWNIAHTEYGGNTFKPKSEAVEGERKNATLVSSTSMSYINEKDRLTMRCVLLGHKSPITAMASATYDGEDAVISVSLDGTICVWSYLDGHCLMSAERLLKCMPTSITFLPNKSHVACAGHRTFIEIVQIKNLIVTSTLAAHQHWITCLFSCDLARSGQASSPLLISAGSDGVVQFWSLREGEGESPLQTLCLEIDEPLSLSLSPNHKTLLIVTAEEWILYTSKAAKEIMTVPCPDVGGWKGGSFINSYTVLVWTKEGNGYVYAIPNTPNAVPLSFASHSASGEGKEVLARTSFEDNRAEEIVVEAPSKPVNNFRSALLSKLKIIDKSSETQPNYICCQKVREGEDGLSTVFINHVGATSGSVFVTGDEHGTVSVWITPSKMDTIQIASRVLPWAVSQGDHGSHNFGLSNVSSIMNNPVGPPKTTASIVVEEFLLLVLGYNNGCIAVTTLPSADVSKVKLQPAHRGPVTSLLSIPLGKEIRVVSGGEDFEINVWGIKEKSYFTLLYKFHNHFGPIVSLFRPSLSSLPNEGISRWRDYFFSISKDKTIGLFSIPNNNCQHVYGVHPTFISNVKWHMEQDYLLVECDDGSVSVWEMGTGRLEATVFGELARDLLKCSSNLLPETNGDSIELYQKSIHAFTICSMQDPSPIQLIFLNVRKLLNDLERALKASQRKSLPNSSSSSGPSITLNSSGTYSSNLHNNNNTLSVTTSGDQRNSVEPIGPPTQSAAYNVFSYFLPWGKNEELDNQCKEQLLLQPPNPDIAFAIRGYGGKMTVLVPSGSPAGFERWRRSDRLSALHTLSAVTYTKNLMNLEACRNICSQLLTHYCTIIPDSLKGYVNPSLSFLARYWRDPFDDVMQAARSIFSSASDALSSEERIRFAKVCASKLKDENEARAINVIVLAVLGSQYADALDKDMTAQVTAELFKLLNEEKDNAARIAAVELIGRGFVIWRPFIKDVDALIQQLFSLSLLSETPYISSASHHSLMLIGAAEPKQFILSLGQYIMEAHNPNGKAVNASQHSAAIMSLGNLIKQNPVSLLPILPRLVETVVRSLDPHVPYLRDTCLPATTKVLHALVKKYPMVSFHQESQRLAVGTRDAVIVIYDLKTATKWHVLEEHGHSGPVTAISFASSGKMLASYSMQDATVKFWSTTSSFLGILGSTPHCFKSISVNKVDKNLSQINLLECVRLKWLTEKSVSLIRTWEGSITVKM